MGRRGRRAGHRGAARHGARVFAAAIRSIWGVGVIAVFLHAIVDASDAARPALTDVVFVFLGAIVASQRSRAAINAADAAKQAPART